MGVLQQLDEQLFHAINTGWHWGTYGGFTPLAWVLSGLGRGETQIVLILLVWLGWRERALWQQRALCRLPESARDAAGTLCSSMVDINRALYVVLIAWASGLLVHIPKAIFDRARPSTLPNTYFVAPDEFLRTHSFPSGHAWSAAAIAVAITLLFGRTNKTFVICTWVIAVGIMLSRIYRGVHYPSDVLAGALMGACFGWLSWRIVQRRAASLSR